MYTIKDVAKITGKCEETIRRWVRSGKLKSEQHSKKEGCLISEDDLQSFLIERGLASKSLKLPFSQETHLRKELEFIEHMEAIIRNRKKYIKKILESLC